MTVSRDAEKIQDDKSANDDLDLLLDRYRLLEQIGKGGMGVVYRANDLLLQREVVVKKLDGYGSTEAIRRFHLEAKAAGKLKHANTVAVHDFGTTPKGELYLVMEYINGRGLDQLIEESEKLPPDMVIDLFLLILRGLDHAHQNGIIHRDIKPSNIMLMMSDDIIEPKLMDFGISRMKEEDQSITQSGVVIGSPGYASPEQIRGLKVDERSDIYSIGCAMFEALTGEPPFCSDLSVTTGMMHINQTAPTLKEKGVPLPSDLLSTVVGKCLEKNPDNRYQSARELSAALKGVRELDYPLESNESDFFELEATPINEAIQTQPNQEQTVRLRLFMTAAIGCFFVLVAFLVVRIINNHDQALPRFGEAPPESLGPLAEITDFRKDVHHASEFEDLRRMGDKVEFLHLNGDAVITNECLQFVSRHKVGTIFFSKTSVDSKALKIVSRMDLLGLHLDHARNVTDQDMKTLTKMSLAVLDLSDTRIGINGLQYVAQMAGLRTLTLSDCPNLTDEGVESISNLPCLNRLDLRNTKITDKALDSLARGTVGGRLEILFLGDCKNLTAAGIQSSLAKMTKLKVLDVSSTAFDDETISGIDSLKSISRLDLGKTKVTDEGIDTLAGFKRPIEILSISRLRISRNALVSLQKMQMLRVLDASGLELGDDGLRYLMPLNVIAINLTKNEFTPEGLVHFINNVPNSAIRFLAVDRDKQDGVRIGLTPATVTLYHNNFDRRSVIEVPIRLYDRLNKEFATE
ncbi:MAG: protein kinase [Candidatus Obscuribacterales bacterium]|nr:protein kinase [Candidatus Obscuribacterales bacterium]